MPYKLLIFTCYGGCATGVAASKACIRVWEENPNDVKIGCLPAVIVPWKFNEIMKKSEKRILIDACGVKCGKKLFEREGMPIDCYIELTSALGIRKAKQLPSKDLEEEVYRTIQKEVNALSGEKLLEDRMSTNKIEELEKQIEELKARWPPHSVPNWMYERLEELEEELERERRSEGKS